MREIKFRAWDIERKTMIMVDRLDFGLMDGIKWHVFGLYPDGRWGWLFDPKDQKESEGFELMQYTGLCDENGKEIYEGDIWNICPHYVGDTRYKEFNGVVEFEGGAFCVQGEKEHEWCELLNAIYNWGKCIGNIHENPELLEEDNANVS